MSFQNAKGDGKATGMPKTPAPRNEFTRALGADRYGQNQYAGPSSLPPGVKHTDPDFAPSDPALDAIIAGGEKSQDKNFQTRELPKGNVPDGPSMSSARERQASSHSAGAAKVPDAIGKNPPKAETLKP